MTTIIIIGTIVLTIITLAGLVVENTQKEKKIKSLMGIYTKAPFSNESHTEHSTVLFSTCSTPSLKLGRNIDSELVEMAEELYTHVKFGNRDDAIREDGFSFLQTACTLGWDKGYSDGWKDCKYDMENTQMTSTKELTPQAQLCEFAYGIGLNMRNMVNMMVANDLLLLSKLIEEFKRGWYYKNNVREEFKSE